MDSLKPTALGMLTIILIVAVPYWIGKLTVGEKDFMWRWLAGIVILLVIFCILLIAYFLGQWMINLTANPPEPIYTQ